MWVCGERFLTCVGGNTHTCTWAHNLGFPDGFDDEKEEEGADGFDDEKEEEGEVSEGKATSFGCSVRLPVLQIFKY